MEKWRIVSPLRLAGTAPVMGKWRLTLFFVLVFFWLWLGVWIWFGGSPVETATVAVESMLPEDLDPKTQKSFVEYSRSYPEPVAVFLYTFQRRWLGYGALVLMAIVTFLFSIKMALTIAREMPESAMAGPPVVEPKAPMSLRDRLISAALSVRKKIDLVKKKIRSLRWKMAVQLTGTLVLTGFLIMVVVYYWLGSVLADQASQRVLTVVRDLSNGAAAHLVKKDVKALRELIASYASLDGVAYVVVHDGEGKIVAHSLATPAPQAQEERPAERLESEPWRTLMFRGAEVLETDVPILDGKIGAVRVAFWRAAVAPAGSAAASPVMAVIFAVVLLGAIASIYMIRNLTEPIIRVAHAAGEISRGKLDRSVDATSRDEIGDLALDLERMRASLNAKMKFFKELQSREKTK